MSSEPQAALPAATGEQITMSAEEFMKQQFITLREEIREGKARIFKLLVLGSLGAILFVLLTSAGRGWTPQVCVLVSAVVFLPSVWAAQAVARHRGVKDPQIVVVDEVLGQWLALAYAKLDPA